MLQTLPSLATKTTVIVGSAFPTKEHQEKPEWREAVQLCAPAVTASANTPPKRHVEIPQHICQGEEGRGTKAAQDTISMFSLHGTN